MPYCSNCGNKVTDEMLFCPRCGQRLVTAEAGIKMSNSTKRADYAAGAGEKPEPAINASIKKSRLYKQWVKYAGLPQEATEKQPFRPPAAEEKFKPDLRLLLLIMGIIILSLCAGLIILVLKFA